MTNIFQLVSTAIGVLMLIIVFIIVPMVGDQMDQSITIGAASEWNHTVNSDVPTGYDTWTSLAGLLEVAALVIIVGILLGTFVALKRKSD